MGNVVAYSSEGVVDDARTIRKIRNDLGLTVTQAAAALRTSAATIETWEAHPGMGPGLGTVRGAFEHFLRHNEPGEAKNLLFRQYPLGLARDILGLDVAEIAEKFGYTKATWQKFESNTRPLDSEILQRLESMVKDRFNRACTDARV